MKSVTIKSPHMYFLETTKSLRMNVVGLRLIKSIPASISTTTLRNDILAELKSQQEANMAREELEKQLDEFNAMPIMGKIGVIRDARILAENRLGEQHILKCITHHADRYHVDGVIGNFAVIHERNVDHPYSAAYFDSSK